MTLAYPSFRGLLRRAFAPTDLGTSKLRLWTRPESSAWQTSARATLETGTGVIGAKDDESGNGFHLLQTTSGLRPTRKTNGGFTCSSTALSTVALGAWAGDFDVYAVLKNNAFTSDFRLAEVATDTAFGLLQSNANKIKFSVANGTPPYGLDSAVALTGIHVVHCWRVGTTASISIDGAAPTTQTVTGSALPNAGFFVGLSSSGGAGALADHHEIAVCAALTSGDRTSMNAYFAARLIAGVYT